MIANIHETVIDWPFFGKYTLLSTQAIHELFGVFSRGRAPGRIEYSLFGQLAFSMRILLVQSQSDVSLTGRRLQIAR